MKRLSLFLIAAGLLFFAGNGFVTVTDSPLIVDGCLLNIEDLTLQVRPTKDGLNEPVNIHVVVSEHNKAQAVGFARLELLQLPETGLSLRIPLSEELKKNRDYQVKVVARTASEKIVENEFSSLPAQGSSSNSFFKRQFNPLPELSELRNSIERISPRSQMRIN